MSSVQLLDGAYLSNLKKNSKWSLGLLLFSPKASFPKAGPSKADQFPKIHETEDRGTAGEGAGRGWCLERKGALGGPPGKSQHWGFLWRKPWALCPSPGVPSGAQPHPADIFRELRKKAEPGGDGG